MSEQRSLALAALAELNTAGAVTPTAQACALLLATLADEHGVVEMSGPELACRLDCTVRTARRVLADLHAAGVIRTLYSGRGQRGVFNNVYRVDVQPIARGGEGDPCPAVQPG